MSIGLKALAIQLNTRIRFARTNELLARQVCCLEFYENADTQLPCIGYGTNMRAAAEDLARNLRGIRVVKMGDSYKPERTIIDMPQEINGRQYK